MKGLIAWLLGVPISVPDFLIQLRSMVQAPMDASYPAMRYIYRASGLLCQRGNRLQAPTVLSSFATPAFAGMAYPDVREAIDTEPKKPNSWSKS